MPCFHPRELVINKPRIVYKWKLLPSGRAVRERDSNGKPIVLGKEDKYVIQVPCGHCPACLAQQQSQWSFRIENEVLYGGHASVLFVTYTYAPEYLPSDYSVHKEEVTRYLHDLRQKLSRRALLENSPCPTVRYYFCAEYGSKFGRPHYHAILFFSHSVDWKIIQSAWGKGIVDIREFSPARAGYVAKYSVKDISLDYAGRERPFHLQSKGLGKCFLNSFSCFASLSSNTYFSNLSGHKVKLPRYYLDKLGTERKYYTYQAIDGTTSRISRSFHSYSYNYTHTLAYLNYVKKETLNLRLYGNNFGAYERERVLRRIRLEQNLNYLKSKDTYHVTTKFEQRSISPQSSY